MDARPLRPGFKDLSGLRFGRLIVLPNHTKCGGRTAWSCCCDCGSKRIVLSSNLLRGLTTSCGCLAREVTGNRARIHGLMRHPGYKRWKAMMERCSPANQRGFKNYGGRGITVCERWHKPENFIADMGAPPVGLTLERVDNNRGYGPDNCIWATYSTQARNRRRPSKVA